MKVSIQFNHMDVTPALDAKIRKTSHKLERFLVDQMELKWVCWVEGNDQIAELSIKLGKDDLSAKCSGLSLYQAIDGAGSKMKGLLLKSRKKLQSRKQNTSTADVSRNSYQIPDDFEFEYKQKKSS